MPIANDMKNIAEGIEVSYGERVEFLSDLFKRTNETLKTFHHEHQKMAGDLWDFLSSDRDNRENVVAALRGKNKRELSAMAETLAHFLKESRTTLRKDTASLMGQVQDSIRAMEKDIADLLSELHGERRKMASNMREELHSATRGRIEEVKKTITSFADEHRERSAKLRHELSSFQKALESSVRQIRAPVINDLKEAKQNWQNLAKIMAAKRAGKVVTPARKLDEVPKQEVAEAVEAFTAGSLKEQILRLISEAASGIGLVQMGRALGIPYIRLAKPASELVKEEKIKKEDSQYFKV